MDFFYKNLQIRTYIPLLMSAMLILHVAPLCAQPAKSPANQRTAEKAKELDKKTATKITNSVENTKDAAKNTSDKIQKATIRKNTRLTRGYHNFTGYFNVYFNSNDSYKEAVKVIDKRYPYDYSDILPVFPFVSDSIRPLVEADLQRTQEKANKTIKLHSITVKPEAKKGKRMNKQEMAFYNKHEYCVWVSDAIFLIGMSNIYLQEYTLARMAFQHIATEYPEDPTSYQARIWSAILEGATDNVPSEENALLPLLTDRHFPEQHLTLRNEAMADLMIRKKDYSKAIRYLEQALKKRWKPSVVQRYHYILGQLYQRLNNYSLAAKHYKRVMRSFAPEKMQVNATINYAYLADGRSSDMRKTLLGMTKKERYADYYDMIYLALAELESRAKNNAQSIEYYRLALAHNRAGSNIKLRISAFHKLAMNYEEHSDFESAQAYYDSTAMVMPINDPEYKTVRNKAQNLSKLAVNLRIIRTQDSLQRIAKMSEPERKKYVERSIAQAKADSTKRVALALQAAKNAANSGVSASGGTGKWYFHNAAIVAKGKEDFKKLWGDRRLADNWRTAANSGGWDEPIEETEQDTTQNIATASSAIADNTAPVYNADYFLRDVPLTQEQMQASNVAVATAMVEAAKAYRDYILDNKSAIKMLENLFKRYPDNEHKMEAYFYLYALYQQENNSKASEAYKQKLMTEFPNSELVYYLKDPAYTSGAEQTKNQADTLYAKAYQHYVAQEYYQAVQLTQEGLSKYKNLPIGANFALLNAMAKGNSTNIAGHIYNLQMVVSAYPNTDAAKTAQDMIALLKTNETKLVQQIDTEKEDAMTSVAYSTDEDKSFFALAFDPRAISVHQVRFDILSFNADLNADNLNIEVQPLSTSLSLMTVGTFQRIMPAMEYYQSVMAANQLADYQQNTTMFVITQSNLDLLMQDRLVSNYVEFFKKNLVKK
ncbi:gliding motility protein [Bacteroidia bacterium]|nr:gliding motility protein [Bacteroidia bacterium]